MSLFNLLPDKLLFKKKDNKIKKKSLSIKQKKKLYNYLSNENKKLNERLKLKAEEYLYSQLKFEFKEEHYKFLSKDNKMYIKYLHNNKVVPVKFNTLYKNFIIDINGIDVYVILDYSNNEQLQCIMKWDCDEIIPLIELNHWKKVITSVLFDNKYKTNVSDCIITENDNIFFKD